MFNKYTKKCSCLILLLLFSGVIEAQQSYDISFTHSGKTVNGTFSRPIGAGRFPTIIINPGSGPNDRDGTIQMIGNNVACLYPGLLNTTLKPYKELSDALVGAGYAVLRYDKLEYTYPTTLGTITFDKLWLPIESAIDYAKTRSDVDTNKIILIGHSEGSAIIPYVAKNRNDVKALISIAGARTPFDSLLAYQLVNIAQTCNGNVAQAQSQANQILNYFTLIRTNTWNSGTPSLFGVPASVWYEYVQTTDSVSYNYNLFQLPVLFTGMELDINVPPTELTRFKNEVISTQDFWSIPGLIHYMTPNDIPHVSEVLTDTIVYWLQQQNLLNNTSIPAQKEKIIRIVPNPFGDSFSVQIDETFYNAMSIELMNALGIVVGITHDFDKTDNSDVIFKTSHLPSGVYLLKLTVDGLHMNKKIIKR